MARNRSHRSSKRNCQKRAKPRLSLTLPRPPATSRESARHCGKRTDVRRSVRSSGQRVRPPQAPRRLERERRRRGAARDPRRAARGRRRAAGGQGLHRRGPRARGRRGGDALRSRPATRWSRSSTTRLVETAGRRGRADLELRAEPPRRDPDGRPAGLGQDHHHRPSSRCACKTRERKKVLLASLDMPPPGGAGAAGACWRGRPASRPCRSCRARRRSRSPRARSTAAQRRGLRRPDPRHRRPPAHRRGADERGREIARPRPARTRPCWSPTR